MAATHELEGGAPTIAQPGAVIGQLAERCSAFRFEGSLWRRLLLACLFTTFAGPARIWAAENFSSVYISEFLAVNATGLKDEDGDRSGWIEIHNGGRYPIYLRGWFLTDTPTNPAKWRFPDVGILPEKNLLVFASSKDRTSHLAPLHADFRPPTNGGYLALVNRSSNVVSEFGPSYPAQTADVSFGRVRGEPGLVGPMPRPTPDRPNASKGAGFAPQVRVSRAGGNFTEPFTVELSATRKDAVIRYTLDGSMPNGSSPAYSAPLPVTNSMQLRARAYQPGLLPGPVHGETYLLLATNVLGFTSSLPVLVMDTFGKNLGVSAQRSFVHLSLHEPVNGRASLTNPPSLVTRAGYRERGSTSAGFPQEGFAVSFIDEFNEETKHALLGLPEESDWTLYAPNRYDPVLIHNPFVHQLSRDMGRYSPRTRFVEVFLVHGPGPVGQTHYHGVYVLEERIKIGPDRVAIDKAGADDLKAPDVTGGYLLKFDRLGPGEDGFQAGGVRMVFVEPKEQVMTLPQRAPQTTYLRSYFDEFDSVLYGSNWRDPAKGYRAFLDVDAAIDYHVLEVLSGNVDALVFSTYFHKPRNGKITFGPHWDFDRALGSTDGRDDYPRMWNTGRFFRGNWWSRLFGDPDFWQLWVDRWQELRRTHFSLANIESLIERQAAELRDAQPRQYARWNFQPRGGSYRSELELMKDWLSNRVDFIDGQLTQPPRMDRQAGRVAPGDLLALTTPGHSTNVTIYYTLDGSDPRLPMGTVSTNAFAYSGPIKLNADCEVVARAWNPSQRQTGGPPVSTPWSSRIKAKFVVGRP